MSKRLGLPAQMGIGMVLGVIVGAMAPSISIDASWFKPLGDLFITLVRMVVVPLVFTTLVAGAASVCDVKELGRVATKTLVYYLLTTTVAVIIGLILANLIRPGLGLTLSMENLAVKDVSAPPLIKVLMDIVPLNPIDALAKGNMLQGIVMRYAPIGVFGLMAFTVANHGLSVLLPLIKLVAVMYLACLLQILVVYLPCAHVAGLKPGTFLKGLSEPLIISFSTCSSAAALSSNLLSVQKLGASKSVSSFSIPLGNTINMDGAAIYMGVAAIFAAEVYGIPMPIDKQLTVILLAVLASIGSMGVPGAALIMITMVFTQVGIPLEAIALIAGVDRIMDMARTTINVLGDATGALLVSKLENGGNVKA